MNVNIFFNRLKTFITVEIWHVRNDQTSKRQFFLIRIFRIFVLAIRRFLADDCQVKASALTYYSLLSVVPVVALAFAIAKGFGFRETLELELQRQLVGQEDVVNWIKEFALSYLDNTRGGAIAGVGVAVLLWSVMKILGNIEKSFNDVWDVSQSRSMVRKFSDYISFMMVATILLVGSSGFLVFITNSIEVFHLGKVATPIITWAFPNIMIWLVFTMMFMIMPNTRVKPGAAIFGGIIAGSLFLFLQFAYINFQVGVSKYNAIYGSFAALPLFLIWLNSSWLIVLLGAELSYSAQNEKSFEFETETENMSYHYRRLVSMMLVKFAVDKFRNSDQAPSKEDFSVTLKLPTRMVSTLLNTLVEAQVLVKVIPDSGDDRDIGYLPAFDIDLMTIEAIVEKMENCGISDFHFDETPEYQIFSKIFSNFNELLHKSAENKLIRDL